MKVKKKIVVFIIVFCLFILLFSLFIIIRNKQNEAESKKPIFKISKILLYSSGYATDDSGKGLLQDLNIHQFTDIAVYIDNKIDTGDLNSKNTVKEIYIDNIKLTSDSNVGEKVINYKNPLLYGEFESLVSNNEKIDFNIIKTNDENSKADYDSPVFFADCSNPITLGYLNLGVVKNYNIEEKIKNVFFDGSILKQANVNMENLKCNLNFTIKIKNNLDEEFTCDIILNNLAGDSSIYKGSYTKEIPFLSYNFIKL